MTAVTPGPVRLRVDRLTLEGSTRPPIDLNPGLNVIVGPVSTGKTSLMRLLRMALGGNVDDLYPEVKAIVSGLSAAVRFDDEEYFIRRRLVSTPTAPVQIAGDGEGLVLPAMRASATEPLSYGEWMLGKLGLPRLEVPTAPTQPADSAVTPVSINDYLRYCRLTQEEIDVDVLGSSVWYKNNKRRIVFRILYGSYDAQVAALQQELRETQSEARLLQADERAFTRFLEGTAFANRAALESERSRAVNDLEELRAEQAQLAVEAQRRPEVQRLRGALSDIDRQLPALEAKRAREKESARTLLQLRNQLQTQSGRLTRAIVAGEAFFDFEFLVCPRCGQPVDSHRTESGTCYLCLQPEPVAQTREDLVREQARVNLQIGETEELIANHEATARALAEHSGQLQREREARGEELDLALEGFVSDRTEQLEQRAARMAALDADVRRLTEYLEIFHRYSEREARLSELNARLDELEAELERAERVDSAAEARIEKLEERFSSFVEQVQVPTFPGHPRAAIDRATYEPIVNGRHLDGLSAGVRVLVNVAHLLAHHVAAAELRVPLPGLLLIDGITKNIGTAEYDAQRIEHVWSTLLDLNALMGDEFQVVVAANDVPGFVKEHIVLELDADDRLIPAADLEAIGWQAEAD